MDEGASPRCREGRRRQRLTCLAPWRTRRWGAVPEQRCPDTSTALVRHTDLAITTVCPEASLRRALVVEPRTPEIDWLSMPITVVMGDHDINTTFFEGDNPLKWPSGLIAARISKREGSSVARGPCRRPETGRSPKGSSCSAHACAPPAGCPWSPRLLTTRILGGHLAAPTSRNTFRRSCRTALGSSRSCGSPPRLAFVFAWPRGLRCRGHAAAPIGRACFDLPLVEMVRAPEGETGLTDVTAQNGGKLIAQQR